MPFPEWNAWILLKISLMFVLKGPISNIPALVEIIVCRRSGDKQLFESMMLYWRIHASLGLNETNLCVFDCYTVLMEVTRLYIVCFNEGSLTLSKCTLAGPVDTGMPPECHWLTQCTLGYHWTTQRILAWYTETPLEKTLNFYRLHWNTTGGIVTAHTHPSTYD